MRKRIIAMLLAAAMCLELLAGCGSAVEMVSVSTTAQPKEKTAVERAVETLTSNKIYTDAQGNLKGVIYSSLDYTADPALAKQNTPIEGVKVTVLDAYQEPVTAQGETLQMQTAADGRFSLRLPEEGQYYLQITADGYKERELVSVIYQDYSITSREYQEQFMKDFKEGLRESLGELEALTGEELQQAIQEIESQLGEVVDEAALLKKRDVWIQKLNEMLDMDEGDFWRKVAPYTEKLGMTNFQMAMAMMAENQPLKPFAEFGENLGPFMTELAALYRNEDGRWDAYWNSWGREASKRVVKEGALWIATGAVIDEVVLGIRSAITAIRAYRARRLAALARQAEYYTKIGQLEQEAVLKFATMEMFAKETLNPLFESVNKLQGELTKIAFAQLQAITKRQKLEQALTEAMGEAVIYGDKGVKANLAVLHAKLEEIEGALVQEGLGGSLSYEVENAIEAIRDLRGMAAGLEKKREWAQTIVRLQQGMQRLPMDDTVISMSPTHVSGGMDRHAEACYQSLQKGIEKLKKLAMSEGAIPVAAVQALTQTMKSDLAYLGKAPALAGDNVIHQLDGAVDLLARQTDELDYFYHFENLDEVYVQFDKVDNVLTYLREYRPEQEAMIRILAENLEQLRKQSWICSQIDDAGNLSVRRFIEGIDQQKYQQTCERILSEIKNIENSSAQARETVDKVLEIQGKLADAKQEYQRMKQQLAALKLEGQQVNTERIEAAIEALMLPEINRLENALRVMEAIERDLAGITRGITMAGIGIGEFLDFNANEKYEQIKQQLAALELTGQQITMDQAMAVTEVLDLSEITRLDNVIGIMELLEGGLPDMTEGIIMAGVGLERLRDLKANGKKIEEKEWLIFLDPILPTVSGRIVDESGTPIEEAQVVIYKIKEDGNSKNGQKSELVYEEYRRYTTDITGKFQFELPSDQYKIEYSKYRVGSDFKTFELVQGDEKNLGDLVLKGDMTGQIHFTVFEQITSYDRLKIKEATIVARRLAEDGVYYYEGEGRTDVSGTVTLTLPDGKYMFEISAPGYQVEQLTKVDVAAGLGGLGREVALKRLSPSPSPKATASPKASPSPKATATPEATPSPKATPTVILSPQVTQAPTVPPSPEGTPGSQVTPAVTYTPQVTPAVTCTPQVTPAVTCTPQVTPAVSPSPRVTAMPTVEAAVSPVVAST